MNRTNKGSTGTKMSAGAEVAVVKPSNVLAVSWLGHFMYETADGMIAVRELGTRRCDYVPAHLVRRVRK